MIAHPFEVLRIRRNAQQIAKVFCRRQSADIVAVRGHKGHFRSSKLRHAKCPSWTERNLSKNARCQGRRLGNPATRLTLASAGCRNINSHHQGLKSCGCDTVYHIAADLRIPRRIKLKPSFAIADGPNGFWRLTGDSGQGIGNIGLCRFACQNTFCIRPDRAGQAHWCNAERNVKTLSQKSLMG